jgi:hypothetical protein
VKLKSSEEPTVFARYAQSGEATAPTHLSQSEGRKAYRRPDQPWYIRSFTEGKFFGLAGSDPKMGQTGAA